MPQLRSIGPGNRRQSDAVRRIAGDQGGIVARTQLIAADVSTSTIDRALRSGRLHRIHSGVYSTQAPELGGEDALLIAALLAVGEGAVLSHQTAAWRWHLIPAPPTTRELAVSNRRKPPPGLILHRSRLRPTDLTLNAGLPTTSVPRTLLDLAATYRRSALLRALAEAEFHHDLRPADVYRALRRGHPGSASLRAALKAHAPGYGEAKSHLERRFRRLLVERGIELPRRNEPLGPWTIDCLWPDRRVAVELDGRQHERPRQADSDDDRDLWLRRNRYVARRYGTKQIGTRPDDVIADLEDAFAQAVMLGYAAA
ncbi:MAG TPA: type IV toxin-antitoxin system AbiEi family antitoxin domain-containing protein [Solirubrobacteraceae bacterium]